MKKRIILACILCLTCVVMLAGCASTAGNQTDEQTKNRQYMSSVNTIMETVQSDLKEFATTLKSGETVSLTSQLSDVNKQVETLKGLEVPDAMKDAHSSYVKAAEELQTALNDYVALYQDVKNNGGSLNAASLASIQEHYDAGIAALKEADNKVSQA